MVRIRAARALASFPRTPLDASVLDLLAKAEKELLEMLYARPDDWASHSNLGNYRMARGDSAGEMAVYKTSMKLRSDAVMPFVNASSLASQDGNIQEAIGSLRHAASNHPEHGTVHLSLGLALAEAGDSGGAGTALRIAMKDPVCAAQAAFNCAVLVGQRNPKEAVELIRFALARDPSNLRHQEVLRDYEARYIFPQMGKSA